MEIEFHTVDVFTGRAFAGNQVAVVPDATGLAHAQMQAIAAEFGYSETAFVLPPQERGSLARVRVFTPRGEVPFAGQPSIGAAFVLGRLGSAHGRPAGLRMVLEAMAGPVLAELTRRGAMLTGAIVRAPRPLEIGPEVAPAAVALCAGLSHPRTSRRSTTRLSWPLSACLSSWQGCTTRRRWGERARVRKRSRTTCRLASPRRCMRRQRG
jgi:trans-2,3-dihydro-3-hydroxyanthranilate isomerase